MSYALLRHSLIPALLRRIRIEHENRLPERGPFVVACNHVSYLETILVAMLVVRRTNQRAYSLTKESVWNLFHSLHLNEQFGMILVPRERKDGVVENTVAKLTAGFPVIVYPEGSRSYDGNLGKGKTGAVRFALAAGVPIIPVGYTGRATATTRGSLATFVFHADEITIRVGEPMVCRADNPSRDDLERMTRDMMLAISGLSGCPYRY